LVIDNYRPVNSRHKQPLFMTEYVFFHLVIVTEAQTCCRGKILCIPYILNYKLFDLKIHSKIYIPKNKYILDIANSMYLEKS